MKKVGYMGIEGSFSQEASILMKKEAELIPLVSAQGVVNALISRNIDFGVLATLNSTAGEVIETKNALKNISYNIVNECNLEIHHCLYVKPGIDINGINVIASHEQALKQTDNNRKKIFENKDIKIIEVEDTALSAKKLSEGGFDDNVGIICSKKAGEIFGLKLLFENIEDRHDNCTHFIMIKCNE